MNKKSSLHDLHRLEQTNIKTHHNARYQLYLPVSEGSIAVSKPSLYDRSCFISDEPSTESRPAVGKALSSAKNN